MVSVTRPSMGSSCMVFGMPFMCMIITGTPADETTSIIPSVLSPFTSLMMSAPASNAAYATSGFMVSTDIGMSDMDDNSLMTGTILSISISEGTGSEPGLVDSPPMSMMSAP